MIFMQNIGFVLLAIVGVYLLIDFIKIYIINREE